MPVAGHRREALIGALGLTLLAACPVGMVAAGRPADVGLDIALTSGSAAAADPAGGIAMIMGPTGIPTPSAAYIDTVDRLYLDPLGFAGTSAALTTPEDSGDTDTGLAADAAAIEQAVDAQLATGTVSSANPIWLFGYSQSTAAAALAAEEFHAQGIPTDDLHFVLVGDSASAHGGFLNAILPSMPSWLRSLVEPFLADFGVQNSVGLTTPDYYPTDVYTISSDGYANWPSNIFDLGAVSTAVQGMFSSHLYYLGLTPSQIDNATLSYTDGLANYYTVDASDVNGWDALVNAAVNLGYIGSDLGDSLQLP